MSRITIEGRSGRFIGETALDAIKLAELLPDSEVKMVHNGLAVTVEPGDEADRVVRRWNRVHESLSR